MMTEYVLPANEEWIEVTPTVKVSGPHHKVSLAGVVSDQPENDPADIRIENDRIFVRARNDAVEDRIFTITYRVSTHGQESFVNTKFAIRHN